MLLSNTEPGGATVRLGPVAKRASRPPPVISRPGAGLRRTGPQPAVGMRLGVGALRPKGPRRPTHPRYSCPGTTERAAKCPVLSNPATGAAGTRPTRQVRVGPAGRGWARRQRAKPAGGQSVVTRPSPDSRRPCIRPGSSPPGTGGERNCLRPTPLGRRHNRLQAQPPGRLPRPDTTAARTGPTPTPALTTRCWPLVTQPPTSHQRRPGERSLMDARPGLGRCRRIPARGPAGRGHDLSSPTSEPRAQPRPTRRPRATARPAGTPRPSGRRAIRQLPETLPPSGPRASL